MPHSYVSVTIVKGTGALNIDGTAYDTRLRQLSEAISQEIDRYTKHTFQPRTGTYFYSGDSTTLLLVNDLIALSGGTFVEDDNNDGTFDVNWAAADFFLLPRQADPTSEWGRPYTAIMVNPKSNGTQDEFLSGPDRYRLIGTFGYVSVTRDSGIDTSGTTGTGTTVTVNTLGVEPGWMILIEDERLYVQSTGTGGTSLTVLRSQYNSTILNHATTLNVNYFVYPQAITEAALIQTARLWQRRNSGFAQTVGIPEMGVITTFRGLDDDVKLLLNPYRKLL